MIKPLIKTGSSLVLLFISLATAAAARETLSLAGDWQVALDPRNVGELQSWYHQDLSGQIKLPGSLPGAGLGDPIKLDTPWMGDINDRSWFTDPSYAAYRPPAPIKVPFFLQPETYYAGAAWYQREVDVPQAWRGRRVVLSLERPHWQTTVWIDDRRVGQNDSLSTAHEFDLGALPPGRHRLSVRVDNGLVVDIGINSSSLTDHSQGNWNGIVGRIMLEATPPVWIDDLQVYPVASNRIVTVRGRIGNVTGQEGQGVVTLALNGKAMQSLTVSWGTNGGEFNASLTAEPRTGIWDEFHPELQTLTARLGEDDRKTVFGFRDLATDQTQFVINGRKTFFRGTLECCIFPRTGHPPTDVASWKHIIRVAKSYGLNLIRFHSWCPPEAAFEAADELGFYFQVECAAWANQSTSLGDGKPVEAWLYREGARILRAYGNHPSFMLMPYGNEPGGEHSGPWLANWVDHWKTADPRRLYTSASGWPQLPENQFHVTPDPRIQAWGAGLKSRINALPPATTVDYRDYISRHQVPVISHEIGEWCVYPDFREIPEYTGYLKPKNFEIFQDRLKMSGLAPLAKSFLFASGKLQALCYKEDIESALRTPGMGGFELLGLTDFTGQGTALVGVLNPFWESKGYLSAREFDRFCGRTVVLARLAKRVYTVDETLDAGIEVANFGEHPIPQAVGEWKLVDGSGSRLAGGLLPARDLPVDNGIALGRVSLDLSNVKAPAALKLVVGLRGTKIENDWNLWVYPAANPKSDPAEVRVTSDFDAAAQSWVESGHKLLLTIPARLVRNYDQAPVKTGFSSIFWNTAWTGRQAPTTLGIFCDPANPALTEFPTDFCSDWQWWYLVHRAGALRMDLLPAGTVPIVRLIDDWVTARSLGLIVEGQVGAGRIVICGFDLTDPVMDDPVSRQMRKSLVDYLASGKCRPSTILSPAQIRSLMVPASRKLADSAAVVRASSEQEGYEAAAALDGDPQTFWHTSWSADPVPAFPHELVFGLKQRRRIDGFTALPRQDGNHNGWIRGYAFFVSDDGEHWGSPVAQGEFSEDPGLKEVRLAAPVEARFFKLEALSGFGKAPYASLAELNLLDAN